VINSAESYCNQPNCLFRVIQGTIIKGRTSLIFDMEYYFHLELCPLICKKNHQFLRFIFKMFSSPWAKYLKLLKLILFGHNTLVKVKFVYYPFYGSRVMHVPSFVISLDQMFRFLYTIILKIMFDYVYYASWFPKYCFSFLYTKNFFHVSKLNTNLLILNCLFVSVLQLAFNTLITMFNFF
jgi:hypothetical protein